MEIMGRINWWFPRSIGWLPSVHIDGNDVHLGDEAAAEGEA